MPANGKPQLQAVPATQAGTSKRKTAPKDDEDDSGSDSGSDVSMINVDFDFYNFNPDVDQIAVKRLLRQTLSHDEETVDVHPLASLILEEGVRTGAGSSIKTDGEESDPWALLGVVDINKHRDNPAFLPFLTYLHSTLPAHNPLSMILNPSPSPSPAFSSRPALLFSLRMLNLPLPLLPPMYKMLLSELQASDGERPFTHWVVWGRGYRLEGGEEGMGLDMGADQPDGPGVKKSKKKKGGAGFVPLTAGTFPYHPEEEFIDKVASHVHTFPFKSAPARDAESFGVEQFGRLVLVEGPKLAKAVEAMEEACR